MDACCRPRFCHVMLTPCCFSLASQLIGMMCWGGWPIEIGIMNKIIWRCLKKGVLIWVPETYALLFKIEILGHPYFGDIPIFVLKPTFCTGGDPCMRIYTLHICMFFPKQIMSIRALITTFLADSWPSSSRPMRD